jgi:hypothetical protein
MKTFRGQEQQTKKAKKKNLKFEFSIVSVRSVFQGTQQQTTPVGDNFPGVNKTVKTLPVFSLLPRSFLFMSNIYGFLLYKGPSFFLFNNIPRKQEQIFHFFFLSPNPGGQ